MAHMENQEETPFCISTKIIVLKVLLKHIFFKVFYWASAMTQWVKAPAAKPYALGSIPDLHGRDPDHRRFPVRSTSVPGECAHTRTVYLLDH